MREIAVAFVLTRIGVVASVLAATSSFPPTAVAVGVSDVPLLNGLSQWDGAAYLHIAQHGYGGADYANYTAYFPLFPLLMRLGGAALGGGDDALIIAGLVVANAATLGALLLLPRAGGPARESAVAAASLILVYPTTIFLSSLYADALFLLFAIGTAVAAERRQWWRSGALAAAAALTRPFGGIAVLALVVALWRERALEPRTVAAVLLAPLVFLAFVAYLYAVTGDPLAVVHGYSSGFTPHAPLQSITDLFDPSVYGFPWLIGAAFALSVVLVVMSWRRTSAPLAAYATGLLVVIALAGSLASSMRYELSLFPMFITLATVLRSGAARVAWYVLSALIAVVFAAMFALGYWVG